MAVVLRLRGLIRKRLIWCLSFIYKEHCYGYESLERGGIIKWKDRPAGCAEASSAVLSLPVSQVIKRGGPPPCTCLLAYLAPSSYNLYHKVMLSLPFLVATPFIVMRKSVDSQTQQAMTVVGRSTYTLMAVRYRSG